MERDELLSAAIGFLILLVIDLYFCVVYGILLKLIIVFHIGYVSSLLVRIYLDSDILKIILNNPIYWEYFIIQGIILFCLILMNLLICCYFFIDTIDTEHNENREFFKFEKFRYYFLPPSENLLREKLNKSAYTIKEKERLVCSWKMRMVKLDLLCMSVMCILLYLMKYYSA